MHFSGTFTKAAAGVLVLLSGVFLCWAWIPGRMTGGGSVFMANGVRVTHGFELHCTEDGPNDTLTTPGPNNLEINWDGGNNFHLEELTRGDCTRDPSINPYPPNAPFNTFDGVGIGRYNGAPGATIVFKLTDAGEPGTNDKAAYSIVSDTNVVLSVPLTALTYGNHQAHKK